MPLITAVPLLALEVSESPISWRLLIPNLVLSLALISYVKLIGFVPVAEIVPVKSSPTFPALIEVVILGETPLTFRVILVSSLSPAVFEAVTLRV